MEFTFVRYIYDNLAPLWYIESPQERNRLWTGAERLCLASPVVSDEEHLEFPLLPQGS